MPKVLLAQWLKDLQLQGTKTMEVNISTQGKFTLFKTFKSLSNSSAFQFVTFHCRVKHQEAALTGQKFVNLGCVYKFSNIEIIKDDCYKLVGKLAYGNLEQYLILFLLISPAGRRNFTL